MAASRFTSTLRSVGCRSLVVFSLIGLVLLPAKGTTDNGYTYSRAITIDHTKVPNTDQTNFPVLISNTYSYLATTANGGNVTNANGYDIIFTSDAAGTSPLAFERESYSASTGKVNFWVRVPTVSHTADTVIYMFYGNSSVTTDQSSKMAVWDSNYAGVWHLPNGSTLSASDSTSNANNGTITGATARAGQIDGAAHLSGWSEYIDVGNGSSLQITGSNLTVEAWVNTSESNPSSYERIVVKEIPGNASPYVAYGLYRSSHSTTVSLVTTSGSNLHAVSTTLPMGTWAHLAGTYNGSNLKLYLNGTLSSTKTETGNINSTTRHVVIGADTELHGEYFNGSIDEVRISNIARSADWIATEYKNQSSPSTFYRVGLQNGGGGGGSPSITPPLSPTSGAVGASVTIAGTNFGSSQGTSTVKFNGTAATATSWSATRIVVPVPSGATSGNVMVTVSGVASNGVSFTVLLTPSITNMSPTSGAVGTSVTIAGTNFGSSQGSSTVKFNGTAATPASWSTTSIVAPVPSGAASGNVVVTVSGVASNGVNFTVLPLQLPTEAQVVAAIQNVNNYWIPNNNAILINGETGGDADWDQATYFTGDLAAYDATGQANYLTFAQTWAANNSYSLCSAACGEGAGGNTTTQPDYQAAGQPYIRLYQLSNNSSDLTGITDSISGMVNSIVDNEWTWADAINMSMPDLAELGSIYNDTNYYAKMYALYSYAKYSVPLYDSTTGLWWENSSYRNSSVHWSRGNGWVFAAHAKVLSVLPNSDPHYAEYLSTFITMAQALAACQQPGGYWNSDLTGTDYAGPESSGTSFFLYGLAWGVKNGILDQNTYLPVVEKAWNFLANTAIQPSGLLGYVQPTAGAPGPTTATTTYDFGVGAFLLAARQMQLLVN